MESYENFTSWQKGRCGYSCFQPEDESRRSSQNARRYFITTLNCILYSLFVQEHGSVFLEQLVYWLRNYFHTAKPDISLPCSQKHESTQSSSYFHVIFNTMQTVSYKPEIAKYREVALCVSLWDKTNTLSLFLKSTPSFRLQISLLGSRFEWMLLAFTLWPLCHMSESRKFLSKRVEVMRSFMFPGQNTFENNL